MKVKLQIYLLTILSFNLLASEAFTQISMKAKVDSTHILIGDWFKLSVEYKFNPEIRIMGSEFIDSLKAVEVLSSSEIDSTVKEGYIIKKQEFTLTSFEPGMQIVPSFRVYYRTAKDTGIRWISIDTFHIKVDAIEVDTSKAIMPIKPPLRVPLHWKDLQSFVIIFPILLIIALLILYFDRKRKNKPLLPVNLKPKLAAHLIAFRELRLLEEDKLWQKGEEKEYHIRLTDIIRQYIEDRYQLPAMESTTDEIKSILHEVLLTVELTEDLIESLQLSDLVKFAKLRPLPDLHEKCLKTAYNFVNQTKESLAENQKEEAKP